ncbi:hypothetical protein [Streptomyces diastatochromogenes]|uniref:hypothetical protein n=1 Tax=Streptomyces diastatochromogenes TaxID=42236 RepID=UPI00142E22C7|nr:hypothetical protein [Streptomyces diastatochromogenes]
MATAERLQAAADTRPMVMLGSISGDQDKGTPEAYRQHSSGLRTEAAARREPEDIATATLQKILTNKEKDRQL